jgi:hypothetical protein
LILTWYLPSGVERRSISGSPKMTKRLPLPVFFQVFGHVKVGVHAGLQDGDAAEFVELGGMGVEVEGAGDEDVEAGVGGFAGGGDEVGAGDGAELRADQDCGAFG